MLEKKIEFEYFYYGLEFHIVLENFTCYTITVIGNIFSSEKYKYYRGNFFHHGLDHVAKNSIERFIIRKLFVWNVNVNGTL